MKKYKYSFLSRFNFFISYFFHKIIIFLECQKGTARIYLAELIWTTSQILKKEIYFPNLWKTDYFETKFGKFFIVPDLVSTIAISPAFERADVNYLLKLIRGEIKKKKKILFIDIGANIGLYSVIVGREFRRNRIDIVAFEPGTSYLSSSSLPLLKKNIQANKLTNLKLHQIGIGSIDSKKKNKDGFYTKTLDSVVGINFFKKYDTVFIKLDVDDFVVDALKGIQASVDQGGKIILLVEDFVDKKSIKYLEKNNYEFITKLSDYNSFWQRISE